MPVSERNHMCHACCLLAEKSDLQWFDAARLDIRLLCALPLPALPLRVGAPGDDIFLGQGDGVLAPTADGLHIPAAQDVHFGGHIPGLPG